MGSKAIRQPMKFQNKRAKKFVEPELVCRLSYETDKGEKYILYLSRKVKYDYLDFTLRSTLSPKDGRNINARLEKNCYLY